MCWKSSTTPTYATPPTSMLWIKSLHITNCAVHPRTSILKTMYKWIGHWRKSTPILSWSPARKKYWRTSIVLSVPPELPLNSSKTRRTRTESVLTNTKTMFLNLSKVRTFPKHPLKHLIKRFTNPSMRSLRTKAKTKMLVDRLRKRGSPI